VPAYAENAFFSRARRRGCRTGPGAIAASYPRRPSTIRPLAEATASVVPQPG